MDYTRQAEIVHYLRAGNLEASQQEQLRQVVARAQSDGQPIVVVQQPTQTPKQVDWAVIAFIVGVVFLLSILIVAVAVSCSAAPPPPPPPAHVSPNCLFFC